ncbi:hypothetical protein EMIHUDRAFT_437881 [Emiliania huxleyi CCMP1516]|uniref:Uncharacterized protein n=2 Tax=Emiliania huxleyi TaxID=2903 RepID=A0A0D3IGW9_EMIH1|nr:hypothetical protein EMIHUDRAFT_437881 [Emiliania huxleyi CCMP1516]EOD10504.1 hypothetical protein EMIHUDRAFT_437881 [Emiliania huxleyi CCMP1516]|eukprot:XP_005762933.1 hypothetical protein EMIHUDRAFT_437881 [Emiliania huxleyi CCMP1516]
MAEVQLPSVFHCLAELLEAGGDAAVDKALSTGGLLGPLWRQLEPAGGGARDAALAAVRGAACSRRGCILVLRQTASGGAADPLARLLRSSDARAKVGAFAVAAQLCSSCARFAADGEVASVQPALRALIAAVSPSAGTAPGDALAALVALPAEEPPASCASRRCGCCSASRSSSGAREMGRYGWIGGDTGRYGEIRGDIHISPHLPTSLGALALARCEGLLHLLLHAEAVLTPDELRDKHALASALLKSTAAADVIGAGAATVRQLREYVAAGPFAAQSKAEARPEGPLTL